MAYGDYLHCIRCDAKVIYDADVSYEYLGNGRVMAICAACVEAIGPKTVDETLATFGPHTGNVMGGED